MSWFIFGFGYLLIFIIWASASLMYLLGIMYVSTHYHIDGLFLILLISYILLKFLSCIPVSEYANKFGRELSDYFEQRFKKIR